jgi:putative transcriptional regulator
MSFSSVNRMKASTNKDLGLLVRTVRQRLDLSQERFAAKLGVTFSSVNRWENGRAKPSPLALKQLKQLVDRLGTDAEDLREEYFRG